MKLNFIKVMMILLVCLYLPESYAQIKQAAAQLWRSDPDAQKHSLNIPSWAPLVRKIQPAVVVITTEAMVEQPPYEYNMPGPFRYLFPQPPQHQRGMGSGFIINEQGYVLTNQHVVEGAQKIKVRVGLSTIEYDATVLGADDSIDVALLKITPPANEKDKKWPFLFLGDSDKMELGSPVMAVGHPFGLEQSCTPGWLVHNHREINPSGRAIFPGVFQFHLGIGQGSSGGPVVNDAGEVIAISESVMNNGGSVAFGIPIKVAKAAIPQLQKGGVEKSYLGVEPRDLNPQTAQALGLDPQTRGAMIMQVFPNTPAHKAGIRAMDVILEVEGKPLMGGFDLRYQAAFADIGSEITLKIYRKGEGYKTIKVKMEKRPTIESLTNPTSSTGSSTSNHVTIDSVGVVVADTDAASRQSLGISDAHPGAKVVSVVRNSPAHLGDLQPGDIILRVGNKSVDKAKMLKDYIDKVKSGSSVLLITRRGPYERFVYLNKP
jgi:serine protease Do